MNKWLLVGIPAALFAFAIWAIVQGIDSMVEKEERNKFHAMLLGCEYKGPLEKYGDALVFKCGGRIELHTEIVW